MRVPIPWVMLLAIAAIATPWWIGTRGADFLTPPDDAELAAIRSAAESALPRHTTQFDAISPQRPAALPTVAASAPSLGDFSAKPEIDEYSKRASDNPAELIDIAARLEKENQPARALLAWERVIDLTAAETSQLDLAFEALRQLRPQVPPWNRDPANAHEVLLQAGTGRKSAEALEPVLARVAAELQEASSGILTVTARVNTGPDGPGNDGPVPIAIWLSGPGEDDPPSTDVLAFTVATPDTLEHDTHRTIYQLIRRQLRSTPGLRPPPDIRDETDPGDALRWGVTRLQWQAFGRSLNPKPENSEDS